MVTYKRKKNTRQRAHTTHGYGSMKKNRGAGHRGGRGRAGSGKRGDVKKPSLMWEKGHKHKGKVGFKSHNPENINTINLSTLQQKTPGYVEKKLITKKGDMYTLNLRDLGFNKLLGAGKVTYKYEIQVKYASEKAIKKIEEAGGKVSLPVVKDEGESPAKETKQ